MIAAKCPCGTICRAPDDSLGKKGKCPRCGTSFKIAPSIFCPICRADVTPDDDAQFACDCPAERHRQHIFTGPPGSIWTNTSSRILYQLQPAYHEQCAVCFRASGHIGPWWPIPMRRGCTCKHHPIRPGETSLPFIDVDAEISRATIEERDLLFGRHHRCLLDAGLVAWRELVGRLTIVDLENVIFNKRLSLEAILAAGIPEDEARAVWDRVSARRSADEQRKQMLRKLKDAGFSLEIEVKRGTS
jgi:hypothetical protein